MEDVYHSAASKPMTETDVGGYVLIGLDHRDEYYIRYYVGQSFKLSTRVCDDWGFGSFAREELIFQGFRVNSPRSANLVPSITRTPSGREWFV